MQKIRWGILGPGNIARKFSDGLQLLPQAKIQAVASSNQDRAASFALDFNVPNIHDSYESLANDPEEMCIRDRSNRYNVSIESLKNLNSGIGRNLKIGQKVRIR